MQRSSTEAQLRAAKNYYHTHKEERLPMLRERNRGYYNKRKDDEEWKECKKEYNRRAYQKIKDQVQQFRAMQSGSQ